MVKNKKTDELTRPGAGTIFNKAVDNNKGNSGSQVNVNHEELLEASRNISTRATMNREVMTLVPELGQAREVVKNSIISPNDYSKKELLPDYDNYLELPENIVSEIKDEIENGITKYKLVSELADVVDTALFETGAYPELIMPRTKVLEIMGEDTAALSLKTSKDLENFTLKDIKTNDLESHGLIKIDDKILVESLSLSADLGVDAVNTPAALFIPIVYDEARKSIMDKEAFLSKADLESINKVDNSILSLYLNYKTKTTERYISVSKDTKLESIDVPFRLKLNSNAVLPIYTDDRTEHIGYFVLADEMNRPILNTVSDNELHNTYSRSIYNSTTETEGNLKNLLSTASKSLNKTTDTSKILTNMIDVAGRVLTETIATSLNKNSYRAFHNIDYENSLLKIMLARALEDKRTSLVYIPSDYMSYIAFDYRKNGTGKTIIEDITLLASFKAMLLLSQIYSSVTSNIPVNDVIVDIDEKDPEPMKTKEILEQSIRGAGRNRLAWGETSLSNFGNWIQDAGYRIVWNHKTFPDTKITMEKKNKENSYTPNTEISDALSNSILRHIGLSPSIIDEANQAEFASVAMINNALSNKINNERQDILNDGMSDKLRKLIKADNSMFKKYIAIVDKHKAKIIATINTIIESSDENKITDLDEGMKIQIAKDIIDGVKVRVPRAESKDNDGLRDKFIEFKDTLKDIIDSLTESSFIEEAVSTLGISKDILVGNIRLIALIDWCEEHNYARGLSRIITTNDKNDLKDLINRISDKDTNLIELAKVMAKAKETIIGKLTPTEEPPIDDGGDTGMSNGNEEIPNEEIMDENPEEIPGEENPENNPNEIPVEGVEETLPEEL